MSEEIDLGHRIAVLQEPPKDGGYSRTNHLQVLVAKDGQTALAQMWDTKRKGLHPVWVLVPILHMTD